METAAEGTHIPKNDHYSGPSSLPSIPWRPKRMNAQVPTCPSTFHVRSRTPPAVADANEESHEPSLSYSTIDRLQLSVPKTGETSRPSIPRASNRRGEKKKVTRAS